ncbi:hypothetical protein GLA29479_2167 [Lysobacter antibioticus]|nr:hypothetical protein GLA29479_2167 [Lysobacter antibioticus]
MVHRSSKIKIKIWIQIKRQKLPPLKRRVTFFCLKQQKSVWIPFGQR